MEKKMNIVYVIEDYSENGGVEKIVSMKANTFYQEYHHQVTVISIYEDKRKERALRNQRLQETLFGEWFGRCRLPRSEPRQG